MELKRPAASRILFPFFWSGLFCLITVPLLLRSAQALGSGEAGFIFLFLSMSAPWLLLTGLAAARAWRRSTWRLMADHEGILLKRGSSTTRIPWAQIDTCREEASPQERDQASWVTLRDSRDNVLLRWERSWFGHSKAALREFDRFTIFVQSKVAEYNAQNAQA